MKIIERIIAILSAALTLCICGCEGNDSVGVSGIGNDGLVFQCTQKNVEMRVGDDFGTVKDLLGVPVNSFYAPDCAVGGGQTVYSYGSYTVECRSDEAEPKSEKICSIILLDDTVSTSLGLKIGDKEEKIPALYTDATGKDGSYEYENEYGRLCIGVADGRVVTIIYK